MSHTMKMDRNRRRTPMDRMNKALRRYELRHGDKVEVEEQLMDMDEDAPRITYGYLGCTYEV